MGLYDEALAKSLETGDTKDLARVMFFGAENLEKAHIKAHFRLNTKTGKREFIKDYDDARHKDEVHVSFHKGHKVKVNNPKSKHHGKMMEVTGYSEKYDVVRGKIDGEKNSVDFHADHLEHHGDKADTPAVHKDAHKVGDKVIIDSDLQHPAAGQAGTVKEVHAGGGIGDTKIADYTVHIPGHGSDVFGHGELKADTNSVKSDKLDLSRYQVYADRPDMDDVVYHIPRDEAKDGEPRFLRVNKKTGDWTKHGSKYKDAPVKESGKGAPKDSGDKEGKGVDLAKLKTELSKLEDALKSSDLRPGTESYIYDRIAVLKQKLGIDGAASGKKSDAKEDKEPTGKISAELKAKIDSLSPTEKFTVVNDYLGLRVHAGDRNFRADKDGGTDRFLAHVNVRDFPIKKIEEAVDRMLAQKDRGKIEPPKRDYSKGVTVTVTKVERLPGGQGDRVAFSYDDGTPVEDKIMAGWSHRHGPSSSDPNPAAIRTMSTYKVGEKYKLTRDNRGMWAEPHHTNKVAEGKAPTDTGPRKDLDVKTTPEKLKYDKFGAHVKSGVSSVSDAEKILKEHGFTWDKSDKSGSLGGAIYEKDGKGVAHFDAAGKTLTIYEPKEKSDSKPDQSKATGAQKQWGTEKEIAAPDAGIGPKSFETRFPHIKEFFEQAENTLELGKLKKQAAKFAASNPEGWKWGPIDHFHKEHAETLRQLGRSGHKQTAAAEHRMDTLLRTRDSSGRATARRRS